MTKLPRLLNGYHEQKVDRREDPFADDDFADLYGNPKAVMELFWDTLTGPPPPMTPAKSAAPLWLNDVHPADLRLRFSGPGAVQIHYQGPWSCVGA